MFPVPKKYQRKAVNDSPTITMNEEWQHMFGANDVKNPPSPKLQQQNSDNSLNSYPKSSANINDESLEVISVDEKSNSFQLSVIEDIKPNHCAPCREELHALIRKKQDEWTSDEIAREASEADRKQERPIISKKSVKVPTGSLIAHLQEHRGAVNRIRVIPSTSLFATCSNDGTVKIWDCDKMEGKNVANRSRMSYNRLDGPVSCMAICPNMLSIAAASETGNIHVFRIAPDNTKTSLVHTRSIDPVEEGCAVDIDYFDTGSQSILAYATVTGSIVGWDLRSPGTAWKLENRPADGLITCFCTDPHCCWLVVGTSIGKMVCWDLRFQLPITTIKHPGDFRIRDMIVHPRKRSAIFTSVHGNNEVSLWDLETQGRLSTLWSQYNVPPLSLNKMTDDSVYSMCWAQSSEPGSSLLTAGSDRRIRYWDLKTPSNSHVIVGTPNDALSMTNVSYNQRVIDGTEVICETYSRREERSSASNEDQSRRYPDTPPVGHHDIISAIATINTTQPLIISAAKDGVVKVWK